jgi:predicted unusual protein kinase regulating ubiquinone biosynthesis (AarF/ABC1/UbiB family)
MWISFLKIAYLRFKYNYFPNSAQKFWAQELINSQGLSAKIGQVLGQGSEVDLPRASLSEKQLIHLYKKSFALDIYPTGEVLVASMGQVFFVRINNDNYALKILHPGIKNKIKKEIKNIIILGKYYSKFNGFSLNEDVFHRFLTQTFEEETDLRREASFQKKFFQIFQSDPRFKIPKVFMEFSNDHFLCQEPVPSDLAFNLKDIPHHLIFDFFFISLFQHGILHGDLNNRNWGLLSFKTVVVYDYGCTQIISGRRISGLIKLLLNQDIINAFLEAGVRLEATSFKGKEQELRDALFNPLLDDPIMPDWSYSKILKNRYGDKIKILREYTDPWILLMMRSLFSLIKTYQSKGFSIPLKKIIDPYLNLKSIDMTSSNIKIEVLEDKKQVVYMILPMTSLDNLQDLMPEKVSTKILQDGIDIQSIIERVKSSGFAPQNLFSLNIQERSYRVWID